MQLYALGTGSVLAGAFSMFLFSLGTVPLLLAFGAAASLLPRKFMPIMIRASAILVLLLGGLTLGRAGALAGISLPDFSSNGISSAGSPSVRSGALVTTLRPADISAALAIPAGGSASSSSDQDPGYEVAAAPAPVTATLENGVQTVVTIFGRNNYAPFIVQAGIPVKWIVRIKREDINGCNRTLIVPAYGIRKDLKPGDNLIEFTPRASGVIPYSCWMGMIRSAFKIVPDIGAGNSSLPGEVPPPASGATASASLGGAAGASGSCCGSATTNPAFAGGRVPVQTIGMPTIKAGVQEIVVTVDGSGYSPAALVLQRGMKAIIRFKASALDGCNSVVYFPEYNGGLDLSKGQLATPEIPITADFTFQCGMGMLHGYVKVVDDLSKVNIKAVKAEISIWQAPSTSGGCCGQ
jgi:plastocyanin domain-containing protein